MLSLARADFGSQEKIFKSINFGKIIENVCDMASPHAKAKGLSFHVSISSERPIVVLGDLLGRQRLA
jgi:signal transduction histidine kinase